MLRFRLDLNTSTDLPKKHGKAIKAVGGEYAEARGYQTWRFVHLPLTPAGEALAIELLRCYPSRIKRTMKQTEKLTTACLGYALAEIRESAIEEDVAKLIGAAKGMEFAHLEAAYDRQQREIQNRPLRLREEEARLVERLAAVRAELAKLEKRS